MNDFDGSPTESHEGQEAGSAGLGLVLEPGHDPDLPARLAGRPFPRLEAPPREGLFLRASASGLGLARREGGRRVEVRAEFLRGPMGYRLRHGGGRGQAVARAVGLGRGRPEPWVLDATAGLGRDAFVLASLGCTVEALESSPVIHALLEDGLLRAWRGDEEVARWLGSRLSLRLGDAQGRLAELATGSPAERPDVVYLDPMHPPRGGSAAVRKEMELLRELLGDAGRGEGLLGAARAVARQRVVVKRPAGAEPLEGCVPAHRRRGRSTRFDLYFP